jgi:3-methyl-2-oxobutanoate hydroxymethyltransferase
MYFIKFSSVQLFKPRGKRFKSRNELDIPIIGIGSGTGCDGQILVTSDLMGLQPWFRPSFVKPKADLATPFQGAVKEYIREIRQ